MKKLYHHVLGVAKFCGSGTLDSTAPVTATTLDMLLSFMKYQKNLGSSKKLSETRFEMLTSDSCE